MHEPSRTAAASGQAPSAEFVLSQLRSLPTLAPIAVRVIRLSTDERSSAADLAAVIRNDPPLTARILSAVNMVSRGAGSRVTTVEQAVPLLGFETTRGLVLAVKVLECFAGERRAAGSTGRAAGFEPVEFWKHCLAVACASQEAALRMGAVRSAEREARRGTAEQGGAPRAVRVDAAEAYVAGLLHDLGKIALSCVFPKAYDRAAAEADQARGDIADCERGILGVDHTVAGRRLAELWGLPRLYQETIWLHHLSREALPSGVESPALIELVRWADTLAREQRIGYSGNHAVVEGSRALASELGLSCEAVDAVLGRLAARVAEQATLLGLDGTTGDRVYLRALSDANAELGRLHEDLRVRAGRLGAAARYFTAMGAFAESLDGAAELGDVARAAAQAARAALGRARVAVFAARGDGRTVELRLERADAPGTSATLDAPTELRAWLEAPAAGVDVARADAPLRQVWGILSVGAPSGELWLVPVVRGRARLGGLLIESDCDESRRLAEEGAELSSFVSYLGLAIETARVNGAIRRLSDDLADSNRRLQQAQARAVRARTLSMIAEMASGAAHELNSPLTVISGRAQILLDLSSDPEVRRSLETIRAKAHECSRIVSELMDFAKPRLPTLADVEVPALVEEVREAFLRESGLPASAVALTIAGPLPRARIDRAQIAAVLRELLNNAGEAIAARPGTITINCAAQPSDALVEITVRDTGVGMTPAVLERAFDPFFSHRRAGRRRGFGLPRAHRIVEAHGGRIWLESRPDEGTTAFLLLPAAGDGREAPAGAGAPGPPRG